MNFIFTPPNLYIFLLIPAAAAAMILRPRERIFSLRLLIYFFLFLIILSPRLELSKPNKKKPAVGIFIDGSLSMGISERTDNALRTARQLYSALKSEADLAFYKFSDRIEKIVYENLNGFAADGESTDLSKVIRDTRYHGKIIISDGRYNEGINPLNVNEINSVPIYVTGPGGGNRSVDLGIGDLKIPGFGFRGEKIDIDFKISAGGSPKENETMVYLKEKGKLIDSRRIEISGKKEIPVNLSFTPDKVGLKNYNLEVKALAEEINEANNIRNFQVNINRKKIRILYVAGRPSWEYSLLRRLLKSDWQIDLVSFLILRNPANRTIVPENELSLIHFPAREMFTKKIDDFDLLIYENFSYKRFFPQAYLSHIKKFVNEGGAFLMMGGKESFAGGNYSGTPLEDILPVDIAESSGWKTETFRAKVKKDSRHPVLDIAGDPEISEALWRDMPPLTGYDENLKAKDGATVLLEGPGGGRLFLHYQNPGVGAAQP